MNLRLIFLLKLMLCIGFSAFSQIYVSQKSSYSDQETYDEIFVDGEKKAKMLQQVLQGEYKPSEFPSQIIKPENGELHWFVDEAAAQDLHSF